MMSVCLKLLKTGNIKGIVPYRMLSFFLMYRIEEDIAVTSLNEDNSLRKYTFRVIMGAVNFFIFTICIFPIIWILIEEILFNIFFEIYFYLIWMMLKINLLRKTLMQKQIVSVSEFTYRTMNN